ncbi:MAG: ATP-dependent helicase HrpB [Janthinobacterium lividum]
MAESTRKPLLPIDALMPQVLASLVGSPNLVLQAEPGAGKTTRVPPALLDLVTGDVLVLEPRRIAARMAARRVAFELGQQTGETAGYQVRFEESVGPATRLRFMTEGILVRRLIADPQLNGVDAVVLDEFHERHLDTDLLLALLRRLQRTTRPDLKLVVMSATLEAAPIAAFLGGCPVLNAPGRVFPLTVAYQAYSPEPLHVLVRLAVESLLRESHEGHTLIFLPGAAEIRRAARECEGVARVRGLLVLPLHGDLSPAEQDRAVEPGGQRKLILATNVAESSVTVEGVTAVIDSGLARIAGHSHWTGLPTLEVRRVSKASATQRAGRAGRTGPGRVLRLFTEADYQLRPDAELPEILRSDLAGLDLVLRSMGLSLGDAAGDLRWLDAPPAPAVEQAEALLDLLGAHGERAKQMARMPLPPRLARAVLAAAERGIADKGCQAAAMLSEGAAQGTDLLDAMDLLASLRMDDKATAGRVERTAQQLRRLVQQPKMPPAKDVDEALLQAMLAGFPDRVARRRVGREILLANGVGGEFAAEPPRYEFMVVLDAEDRREKPLPLVRTASRIEPEWLIDQFADRVREVSTLSWNRKAERVEAVTQLLYDNLQLQEWRDTRPDAAGAAAMLVTKAEEAGLAGFVDEAAMENLLARAAFAGLAAPDASEALRLLCLRMETFTFAELRRAAVHLLPALESGLDAQGLRELAPPTLKLKHGRPMKVTYETGKPPWIASRMQDFFGMQDGPSIGPHRTPVVMHLLGPNNRAVQTTADLRGFWERLYPEVRRSLMRRYPKQNWPEKPV